MEKSAPTFAEALQNSTEKTDEFVQNHRFKEKCMGFAHHCHQKAEEYQLKEKAIGAAEKTKEFLTPYAQKAAFEAKIMGNYLWGVGWSAYDNYKNYRTTYIQGNDKTTDAGVQTGN